MINHLLIIGLAFVITFLIGLTVTSVFMIFTTIMYKKEEKKLIWSKRKNNKVKKIRMFIEIMKNYKEWESKINDR